MNAAPLLWLLTSLAVAQAPITGKVLDAKGQPVPEADVALSAGLTRDGTVPIVAATRTDAAGNFSLSRQAIASKLEIQTVGTIWALKPGLGLGMVDLLRNDRRDSVRRVVLETAVPRMITLEDAQGKPLTGVRVAPRLVQNESSRYDGVFLPDAWLDWFSAMSDARGRASLPGISPQQDLRTVMVTRPGGVRHVLPLPYSKGKDDVTLTFRPSTRLAGRIGAITGPIPQDAVISIWARCAMPFSSTQSVRGVPEPVRFQSGPIHVRPDGTFETSDGLEAGTIYRVAVTHDGFAPALSDWVKLDKQRVTSVAVTLRPLVKIEGRVIDRQARPVAGALIRQPGGGPEAVCGSDGRFVLERARPGPSFLIARKPGFRFHGLAVGDHAKPIEIVLTRESEPADSKMATLPEPLSPDESRVLARQVLKPALQEAGAKGDDAAKFWLMKIERWLDPPALLEHIEKTRFTRPRTSDLLKGEAALGLVATDPEEALAVTETIADPGLKAGTLVDLVDALPPSELPRKQSLLDQAAMQARAAELGSNKLFQMGEVAERWLELGEKDKALALFTEGRNLVQALPPAKRTDTGSFLSHLSRIDPKTPVDLIQGIGPDRWNQRILANIAIRAAFEHPAEAEQVWRLLHEPTWRQLAGWRICRRLARSDPDRARRIAVEFPTAAERAYAWSFLADGLVVGDPAGAHTAFDKALRELDEALTQAPSQFWEVSPSASILPLCERIAPERVAEVFWRAVSEQPPDDDPRDDFSRDHPLVDAALLLARYDRNVAATLLTPVAAFARSAHLRQESDLTPSTILALGCIDPRAAAAVIDDLPGPPSLDVSDPTNWARQNLGEHLAMPPARRWMRIWRFHSGCGTAMFEETYRNL